VRAGRALPLCLPNSCGTVFAVPSVAAPLVAVLDR